MCVRACVCVCVHEKCSVGAEVVIFPTTNSLLFSEIQQALCNPGPDLVVCDEGHRIKNDYTHISQALKRIRTRLTGSQILCGCSSHISPPPPFVLQETGRDDRVPPTEQSHRVLVHGRLCSTKVPWNEARVQ